MSRIPPFQLMGLPLHTFAQELHPVSSAYTEKPILTHSRGNLSSFFSKKVSDSFEGLFGNIFDYGQHSEMPWQLMSKLPFDILHKANFSDICTMRAECLWEDDRFSKVGDSFACWDHSLVRKIKSSLWRYGHGRDWNTTVNAYNGIRKMDFGPLFETRLTWARGNDPCGWSPQYILGCGELFIDGKFGALLHYKGKHVLTIGFSFSKDNCLLVQQIQCSNRTGNRWMFKLRKPLIEFVLERLVNSFSELNILLIDGESAKDRLIGSYGDHADYLNTQTTNRVKLFYDSKLSGFSRNGKVLVSKHNYHKIQVV